MPYLVKKKIDGTVVEHWEITDKPRTFGRGEQADHQIKDERMSRQHFAIAPKDKGYILQDLKSTNGTFLNNVRVTEEAALKANDRIRVGQTILTFVTEKPKGMETVMEEIEKEGKGLKTYIGELNKEQNKHA
jgi:pSer/pThr/pTyr-binding forkhead associated (FHA) protein